MPTGYTAKLYEGEDQSVRDFILSCARAFGATIMQRDDDPNDPPKPREISTHYEDSLREATKALDVALAWTDEEAGRLATAEDRKDLAYWRESEKKSADRRVRYEAMLTAVTAWVPPTSEHNGLKTFMVEQITGSIKWDCSTCDAPTCPTGAEYRELTIKARSRDVTYYTEERQKEIERVDGANAWITALYDSLKAVSA